MSLTVPDLDASLEFEGVWVDQTEETIFERVTDWANEGVDPVADADSWTDTREGGHWHMCVFPAVREIARLYDLAGTEIPMCAFVVWAWGTYLDDLAAQFDVERLPATQAVGVETFSGPAGTDIALGTTIGVAASSAVQSPPTFSTVVDAVIPDDGGGLGSVDVPIMADEAGADGDVAAGAIVVQCTPLDSGVTFTNAAATGGGSDPETDDALRGRVLQAIASGKGPGNVQDLLRVARAWPGVGSAKVVPTWDGPNTALIVIGDPNGQPLPSSIVADLQEDVDPVAGKGAGTAAIGQQITVATPVVLTVNVSGTITYETGFSADGAGGTIAVKPGLSALLAEYLLSVIPGDTVVLARVAGIIATYPGVHDVTNVRLNGTAANLGVSVGPPPQAPTLGTLTI